MHYSGHTILNGIRAAIQNISRCTRKSLKNDTMSLIIEPRHRRKPFFFCICENKDADQLRGNREADQRLCFRYIPQRVQSLCNLNPKFQASNLLLWLYSLVCVRPGQKPRRRVFSQRGSLNIISKTKAN